MFFRIYISSHIKDTIMSHIRMKEYIEEMKKNAEGSSGICTQGLLTMKT